VSHYYLGDVKNLGRVLKKFGRTNREGALKALRETARFGVTAVSMSIARLKIVDTGQYLRSFRSVDTKDGAEVTSSEAYAPVIELGRKPGSKPPPLREIEEWLARKLQRPRKPRKKKPKKPKTAAPKTGLFRAEVSRGRKLDKLGRRRRKKKKRSIEQRQKEKFKARVWGIRMAIARRGLPAKKPVEKALPKMRSFLSKEMKRAMDKSSRPV
jgi:hypothetical protein